VVLLPVTVKLGSRIILVAAAHVTAPLAVTLPLTVIVPDDLHAVLAVIADVMVSVAGSGVAYASVDCELVPPLFTAATV
jgi:hypothetical protein